MTINPFLKWAGGKRWLVSSKLLPIPAHYERYVEPFLGGGAIFFHIGPSNALISDINDDLLCLYRIVKDHPLELFAEMAMHQERHSKEYYYAMRSLSPDSELKKAARLFYLNRTCWNGLYRVNLKGEFNVPIGTKNTVLFDTDDFEAISRKLNGADIRCADFEEVINECGAGDFLFVDPPYTVQHNYNNFLKYNEKIFSWEDQLRLCSALKRAAKRGAALAITNADHQTIRDLYEGVGTYTQLHRSSLLAGKASKRGATTEALFLENY